MLKYKFRQNNFGSDVSTLDTTRVERQNFNNYDISGNIVHNNEDKETYKVWVSDVKGLNVGSIITYISTFVIDGVDYQYVTELLIDSISHVDKHFTVLVNKFMEVDIANIFVESRYVYLHYLNNEWILSLTSSEWLDENKTTNFLELEVDKVYLSDNKTILFDGISWKALPVGKEFITGKIVNGKINLNTIFDTLDSKEYSVVNLDKSKKYFGKFDILSFQSEYTHYFHKHFIERNDGGDKLTTNKTDNLILSVATTDSETGLPIKVNYVAKVEFDTQRSVISSFSDFSILNGDGTLKKVNKTEYGTLIKALYPNGYDINIFTNEIYPQRSNLDSLVVLRDNFLFNSELSSFVLISDKVTNYIPLTIEQNFETDLHHEDGLKTNFIDVYKNNSINKITDYEKVVFSPVIQNNVGDDVNAGYTECRKIIFNLHFREHRDNKKDGIDEEWKCQKDCYWNGNKVLTRDYVVNGVTEKKKIVDFKGRVFNYDLDNGPIGKTDKYDYFSYFGEAPRNPASKTSDGYDNPDDSGLDSSNDYVISQENLVRYKEMRNSRTKLLEYQSDLLSYLGFTNDDVKYQKSKLKKSFIRISFYDSDNVGNQNLLHTSTIFLDSGNLFAKYIKNIETHEEYKVKNTFILDVLDNTGKWVQSNPIIKYSKGDILSYKEYKQLSDEQKTNCRLYGDMMAIVGGSSNTNDLKTVYDKVGLRVNREPMRERAINLSLDFSELVGELERLRMSSQIEVSDKNSSKRSSEGFYFYSSPNNLNGVLPSEIYMRVEFNHAGYGRTIPFFLPYIQKSEEEKIEGEPGYLRYTKNKRKNKIKTFDDIAYDWSEIDYDMGIVGGVDGNDHIKDINDVGYSTLKYLKYSFIKWKCRYDKYTQKYVYYLDSDVYGSGVTSENKHGNNIILNLYEGKVR